jgi:hypothetical protein
VSHKRKLFLYLFHSAVSHFLSEIPSTYVIASSHRHSSVITRREGVQGSALPRTDPVRIYMLFGDTQWRTISRQSISGGPRDPRTFAAIMNSVRAARRSNNEDRAIVKGMMHRGHGWPAAARQANRNFSARCLPDETSH